MTLTLRNICELPKLLCKRSKSSCFILGLEEIREGSDDIGVEHDLEGHPLPVSDLLTVPNLVNILH